jgi:hypothetical protein
LAGDEELELDQAESELRGGTTVPVGQLEAVVLVQGGTCTGTLISPSAVLTAAHCVCNNYRQAQDGNPEVGSCTTNGDASFLNVPLVGGGRGDENIEGEVIVHPRYGLGPWNSNDYALILLEQPARDVVLVNPMEVASPDFRPQAGDAITLVGYSMLTGPSCGTSNPIRTKRQATLPFQIYSDYADPLAGVEYGWNNSPLIGSCPGDSGGPAIFEGKIIGVSSTGNNSTNFGYDATFSAADWLSAHACPPYDQTRHSWSFCTEMCPCTSNEGDCDESRPEQCRDGLVCETDLGYQIGAPRASDVCQSTAQMAMVFTESYYGGASKSIPAGTYEANDLASGPFPRVGNDSISSMIIPPGFTMKLCTDHPGIGTCNDYSGFVPTLDWPMNNTTSYLEVRPAVTIYEGPSYTGLTTTLGIGYHEVPDLAPVRNDAVSSLKIGPGVTALLCTDHPGIGVCRRYAGEVPLVHSDVDNRMSTIVIEPGVTLYEGKDFTGITESLPVGEYTAADFPAIGHDRLSSLIASPGIDVLVCSDNLTIGTCRAYSGSTSDLGDLDHSASTLVVRPAVTLYSKRYLRGQRETVIAGAHTTGFDVVDGDITSLSIGPGLRAWVCTSGWGNCVNYGGQVGQLPSTLDNKDVWLYVY